MYPSCGIHAIRGGCGVSTRILDAFEQLSLGYPLRENGLTKARRIVARVLATDFRFVPDNEAERGGNLKHLLPGRPVKADYNVCLYPYTCEVVSDRESRRQRSLLWAPGARHSHWLRSMTPFERGSDHRAHSYKWFQPLTCRRQMRLSKIPVGLRTLEVKVSRQL